MTDAERQAVNERIATAMGLLYERLLTQSPCWKHPTGTILTMSPPDFFRDPVAFMALWEWLRAKPRQLEIGIHVEARDDVDVYIAELDCPRCGMRGNALDGNIMAALALVADAAITEASGGE